RRQERPLGEDDVGVRVLHVGGLVLGGRNGPHLLFVLEPRQRHRLRLREVLVYRFEGQRFVGARFHPRVQGIDGHLRQDELSLGLLHIGDPAVEERKDRRLEVHHVLLLTPPLRCRFLLQGRRHAFFHLGNRRRSRIWFRPVGALLVRFAP